MTLALVRSIALPHHPSGGFDHGDVHLATGRVFVAHTAAGTVEVLDGDHGLHSATIPGCPEASGVLCAQHDGLVFAAARAAGKVLVIEAVSGSVIGVLSAGSKPNGLAWDAGRKHLLVADVHDARARLVDTRTASVVAETELPGRPRWCVYDGRRDRFLVNVREPACVAVLAAGALAPQAAWPASATGPHGLDLDEDHGLAYVACDGGRVLSLDLETGRERAGAAIAGEPDAIWYNAARSRLYVAIGRPGVVDVVDTREMVVAQEIQTEAGAHTTAFDRTRQLVYVFLPQSCLAAVYAEG